MVASTARVDADIKIEVEVKNEVKSEPESVDADIKIEVEVKNEVNSEPESVEATSCISGSQESPPEKKNIATAKSVKRIPRPPRGPFKRSAPKPILHVNRRRLSGILRDLARAHNWREASGVLSVLLSGTPRASPDDRRNFLVAMEIYKRFGVNNYNMAIKKIYSTWLAKLAWTRKSDKKKKEIDLELALFHLAQGNINEAQGTMKILVENPSSASVPAVNLIYGLILYDRWYSYLLEVMRGNGFDISIPSEKYGMPFNDDNEEPETVESSNDHNAVDLTDARFSSQYASESSVGNNKTIFVDCKNNVPTKQDVFAAHGFYISRSADMNEERDASPNHDSNFSESSIFLAHGLDTSLLPIRLKHVTGDLEQIIYTYRKFANEIYRGAVKHLRLALYSTPPLLAALLPLIQILLLGDRVEEAIKELEIFCHNSDAALPFRLRARLLEVFHSNQTIMISSCYENVLKMDPTCSHSLEALIRMHKTGNYSSILLLEMIALHLDAADGNCSIWEEFASCFLKLLTAAVSEYEDCMSTNVRRGQTDVISSSKVPKALTEGHTRDTWRIRCRWWVTRHFSRNTSLSEMQVGDWKLLTAKAACASHLYGPRFDYVIAVLSSLRKEGDSEKMSLLCMHMQNSMKLHENLD